MDFDPDAYLAAAKAPPPEAFDPDAYLASKKPEASYLEGAARGAAPVAGALGAGALIGGGLGFLAGGPPGAVGGAMLGSRLALPVLSAGEMGARLYNTFANRFGGTVVPTPVETFQNAAERVGVGRPGAPVTEALVGGALSGGISARGMQGLGDHVVSPVWAGVLNAMAQQPKMQAAAGATGAALPASMAAYGDITNPVALTAAGLAGGAVVPASAGALRLGAKGVTAGVNRFAIMSDPESAAWLAAVEGRGPEVVNALRANAESPVPGYNRTAAQAAVEAGAPGFQALGRQMSEVSSTEPFARTQQQEGAVRQAVRRVGGTKDEINTMKDERAAEAKANYKQSDPVRVEADDDLNEILARPAVREAMAQARKMAANKGETFGAADEEGGPAIYSGQDLHRIKVALDDMTRSTPDNPTGEAMRNSIKNAQNDLMDWTGGRIPEYDIARGVFREQSQFINQAEVGRFLEKKLFGPIEGKGMTPGPFVAALDDPPKKIIEKVPDLTDKQRKALQDVADELTRDVQAKRLAAQGAGAAPNITRTASDVAPGKVNLLNRIATIANTVIEKLEGAVNKETATRIAAAMLEPEIAAARIESSMARQAKFDRFKMRGPDGLGGGAFGASQLNVMSPYGDLNQNAMAR